MSTTVPLHVLTAGGVRGANVKSVRRVHDAWQTTVGRAASARYTNVPESGHQMPIEAPDVVTDAVLGVLDAGQARAEPVAGAQTSVRIGARRR